MMKSTHEYNSKMSPILYLETRYIFNNILILQMLQKVNYQHHRDAYPFSAKKVNWKSGITEMQWRSGKNPVGSVD